MNKKRSGKGLPKPDKKQNCSFNPDVISDTIHQILKVDLANSVLRFNEVMSPEQEFFVRTQTRDFKRKYKTNSNAEKNKDKTKTAAFKKLAAVLDHLANVVDNVQFPDVTRRSLSSFSDLDRSLLRARAKCHEILGEFDLLEVFERCRHSGGTTQGVSYERSSNIEDKFQFPISATKGSRVLFKLYMEYDTQLCDILLRQNGVTREYFSSSEVFKESEGSRFTSVDKNDEVDRIIAIESTAGMYLQQGLMDIMVDRLRPYLDITKLQERHKFLAWLASVCPELLGTIDFSSASDCILTCLVKFLLPPKWYNYLWLTRSHYGRWTDGSYVELPMISTMGNATTFPLETLVFYVLGYAVSAKFDKHSLFGEPGYDNCVSVYGDDCILRTENCKAFMSLCEHVGLIVNVDKTYIDPGQFFRESCGGDFIHGRNVRPYYIKAPHNCKKSSLEPWLYINMNRLFERYRTYFGNDTYIYELDNLITYFSQLFMRFELTLKFVPVDFPDDAGLKVYDFKRYFAAFSCKGVTFSPVLYNEQDGLYLFNYCRFNYNDTLPNCPEFQYWNRLRFPDIYRKFRFVSRSTVTSIRFDCPVLRLKVFDCVILQSEEESRFKYGEVRRNGGYNVGRAFTSRYDLGRADFVKHTKLRMKNTHKETDISLFIS